MLEGVILTDSLMSLMSLLLKLQVWKQLEISDISMILAANRVVHSNGNSMSEL